MSFLKKTNKVTTDRTSPLTSEEIQLWLTDRRTVLKAALISGALTQFSFLTSCTPNENQESANEFMDANQVRILKSVLAILFPDDGNGPSVQHLNTYEYILWVLRDPGANQDFNSYLIDGITWADEQAMEHSKSHFWELNEKEQARAVSYYVETSYGKEWCSILLTFVVESLLLDPIYGGNQNEAGWKWLNHTTGLPRPNEATRYENILDTVRADYKEFES